MSSMPGRTLEDLRRMEPMTPETIDETQQLRERIAALEAELADERTRAAHAQTRLRNERDKTAELSEDSLRREIGLRKEVDRGAVALAVLKKFDVVWEPVTVFEIIMDGGERAAKFLTAFKRDRDAVLNGEAVVVTASDAV